ncbi:MAG: FAD-dependent oxidoreductase, partial [Candidatus Cloacimonetes bacterium]|nr:FAD-dependent oxidoreductase [Candidatus Cloacimonadota bacterium]
ELESAIEDGIEFNELLNPITLENGILKCQMMQLGEKDNSGRRSPVPLVGKFKEFKIDTVLSAIGEMVDYEILEKNNIEIKNGNITVDKFNETSIENVFIAGDAFHGSSTVIEAIASAQIVANGIMKKENIALHRVNVNEFKFDEIKRLEEIDAKKAIICSSQKEEDEPNRCLECNIVCNKCMEVCPNRANIALYINSIRFKDLNQIIHLDGLCNECANCETFCPYDSAPYKDKFTLFWSEEDFNNSENDGFFFIDDSDDAEFKIRLQNQTFCAKFSEKGKIIGCEDLCDFADNDECYNMLEIIWAIWENYRYLI